MLGTEKPLRSSTTSSSASSQQYDDTYQFTLPAKFKKIALDELREDDNIRSQALSQFREWIAKHPHIKKCRTGNPNTNNILLQ